MSTVLLVCAVTACTSYFGCIPKEKLYIVRSDAQCSSIARDEYSGAAIGTLRSRREQEAEISCGPDLRDCEDRRQR